MGIFKRLEMIKFSPYLDFSANVLISFKLTASQKDTATQGLSGVGRSI